ncbi:putative pyridoxamine phosphate oxidase family protein [Phaeoacremonium minimum UCRPA7]|uniref:Putative pyridoxamine phosphate oxidase family protein n=1 Tax=Phaeoacremonium minimum (strain UCR-PA7) TaxID=1286976 RepID=R8BW99_PHAM7|nr:putative pyridoxamine phosphate oxidase family protein [Phaeoacremonium minimum UCRPA7]EOO03584.1 putative pyridoxamine phosphate oxidase family protein [Phaeoacremonium minimum UCRPA7]
MKLIPSLTPSLTSWVLAQPVFYVASAPTHGAHVNVSPKGLPSSTFSVLSPNQVAYLDRTGSGCETIAHLYENGRITIMFMSVGASPRILRLFGRGRVVEWDSPLFAGWLERLGKARPDAVRSVIVCDVFQVSTSCGYGVPRVRKELYLPAAAGAAGGPGAEPEAGQEEEEEGEQVEQGEENGKFDKYGVLRLRWDKENSVFEDRPTLVDNARKRQKAGKVLEYQVQANLDSLDGLPGLRVARREAGQWLWAADAKAHVRRVLAEREAIVFGFLLGVLFYLVLSTKLFGAVDLVKSADLADLTAGFKQQLEVLSSARVKK